MALLKGISKSGFLSFWAINTRTMSTAPTGASGTWAAGPALGGGGAAAAAGAELEDEAVGAGAESLEPAVGAGSSSTGSTS